MLDAVMSSRTYVFLLFPNLLKFFQTQPYVNGFDCSLSGNGEGWQEVCLAEEAKFKKEKAQLKVISFFKVPDTTCAGVSGSLGFSRFTIEFRTRLQTEMQRNSHCCGSALGSVRIVIILLYQCGSGSMDPNQCGSMLIRIRISVRFFSNKKLNFFMKNMLCPKACLRQSKDF